MLRILNFFLLIIEITKMDVSFGNEKLYLRWTVSKVSIYEVFSSSYFPLFGLNTGKYGPEKTAYLDTFRVVMLGLYFTLKSGLILTTCCVRYSQAVLFLRNEMPFLLLKTPKTHAV